MIEIRKILLKDHARLPNTVPDPPDLKEDPAGAKVWLEEYHTSILGPIQQQFRDIQQAIINLQQSLADSGVALKTLNKSLDDKEDSATPLSAIGEFLSRAASKQSVRLYLEVPAVNQVVRLVGDQAVQGDKTFTGRIRIVGMPTHADDAAAGSAGLISGELYKTATGELRIKL
jgi:hypothetical protein